MACTCSSDLDPDLSVVFQRVSGLERIPLHLCKYDLRQPTAGSLASDGRVPKVGVTYWCGDFRLHVLFASRRWLASFDELFRPERHLKVRLASDLVLPDFRDTWLTFSESVMVPRSAYSASSQPRKDDKVRRTAIYWYVSDFQN